MKNKIKTETKTVFIFFLEIGLKRLMWCSLSNKVDWQRERIERDRERWSVLFAFDSVQYDLCKVDIKILQLHKKHDFKKRKFSISFSLFVSSSYRVSANITVKTINKFWTKNDVIIQLAKGLNHAFFLNIKCFSSFNLVL